MELTAIDRLFKRCSVDCLNKKQYEDFAAVINDYLIIKHNMAENAFLWSESEKLFVLYFQMSRRNIGDTSDCGNKYILDINELLPKEYQLIKTDRNVKIDSCSSNPMDCCITKYKLQNNEVEKTTDERTTDEPTTDEQIILDGDIIAEKFAEICAKYGDIEVIDEDIIDDTMLQLQDFLKKNRLS